MVILKNLLNEYGFPLNLIKFSYNYSFECDINLLELSYLENLGYGIFPKNFNGFNFPLIYNEKDKAFLGECYPQFLDIDVNLEKSNNLSPFEIAQIYFKNILLKNKIFSEHEADEICIYVKVKNKYNFIENQETNIIINKFNKFINKIITLIGDFCNYINSIDNSDLKFYIINFLLYIKKEAYKNKNITEVPDD